MIRQIFLLSLFMGLSFAQNRYPIILVHGFLGWGPEEMGGYKYWGGKYDIEQDLKDRGFEVYTVSIGPVSSNWDRAVELYYQIKGGQVDYGQAHSIQFGLVQKPEEKNYPGLYPPWDQDHPIHLIGHSMGGQTVRMLQYLLSSDFNTNQGKKDESFLLGHENFGWIKSITTMSAPHNGTTLSDILSSNIPFLQDFIAVAAVVGNKFYDFDLQQWGFKRKSDESWLDYFRHMREHPAWKTKNISAFDLSIEGARQMNSIVHADSDCYYFSFATSNTTLDPGSQRHIPDQDMSFIIRANARFMGMKKAYWADGSVTDSTWFENDGIVNTNSMAGPTSGLFGADPIADYRPGELLMPGQWYFMGTTKMDHKRFIGHGLNQQEGEKMLQLFFKHAELLWDLEK
ncbi:MAG: lipase [Candidatus Neomarinimicrobiota bacterium]